jgi:uncharacterized membrane protein
MDWENFYQKILSNVFLFICGVAACYALYVRSWLLISLAIVGLLVVSFSKYVLQFKKECEITAEEDLEKVKRFEEDANAEDSTDTLHERGD